MLFEIDHLTRYDYSLPVQLDEQTLRFLPRLDGRQQPLIEEIQVDPPSAGLREHTDTWGNRLRLVRFATATEHLEIRVHLQVRTLPTLPPVWPAQSRIAPDYAAESGQLSPYLAPLERADRLEAFIAPLRRAANGELALFLDALNLAIHAFYHRGVRLQGNARAPAETLRRGGGVCRDLALLFIAVCRAEGIAARFVSGYQQGLGQSARRDLHAWAEVYVPTLGWLGYDPTQGVMTGAEHLAIAAAPAQEPTMPLAGGYTFVGHTLTSTLTTEVHIATR